MAECVWIVQLKTSVKESRSQQRETEQAMSVLEEELSSVKQSSNKLTEQLQLKVTIRTYHIITLSCSVSVMATGVEII